MRVQMGGCTPVTAGGPCGASPAWTRRPPVPATPVSRAVRVHTHAVRTLHLTSRPVLSTPQVFALTQWKLTMPQVPTPLPPLYPPPPSPLP